MRSLIIIIIFICSLVITLPAKLAYNYFKSQNLSSLQGIKLVGINGSIFSGHARQAFLSTNNKSILLNNINWSFNPLKAIFGSYPLRLNYKDQKLSGELEASYSLNQSISLSSSTTKLDLSFFNLWLDNIATINGIIELNIKKLTINNNRMITNLDLLALSDNFRVNTPLAKINLNKTKFSIQTDDQQQILVQLNDPSKSKGFELKLLLKQQNNHIALRSISGFILPGSPIENQLKEILPVVAQKSNNQWNIKYTFPNTIIPIKF